MHTLRLRQLGYRFVNSGELSTGVFNWWGTTITVLLSCFSFCSFPVGRCSNILGAYRKPKDLGISQTNWFLCAVQNGEPSKDTLNCGWHSHTVEGKLLWATALALVLLMGKFLDQQDKWEMIAKKKIKMDEEESSSRCQIRECLGSWCDFSWFSNSFANSYLVR